MMQSLVLFGSLALALGAGVAAAADKDMKSPAVPAPSVKPGILRKGPKRFAAIGTAKSKGTKVFSLTGKVLNTGLIKVPMGTTSPAALGIKGGTADKDVKKPEASERKAVKGTLIQIDGNKDRTSKIKAGAIPTRILIEWTYPTASRLHGHGSVTSSNPAVVGALGVSRLVKANCRHGHGLAALFVAKGKGEATLTFLVRRGKDTVKITSHVHVKGKSGDSDEDEDEKEEGKSLPKGKAKILPKDKAKTSP
jgi:hypothetical protein